MQSTVDKFTSSLFSMSDCNDLFVKYGIVAPHRGLIVHAKMPHLFRNPAEK